MRTRPRSLTIAAATAAVTAASLPLWAATAGAGGEYDEYHLSTRTVAVDGVNCQIRLASSRYANSVYARTEVLTPAEQCRTTQVFVNAEFLSDHGDTVSASSDSPGPVDDVAGGGARDLVRTYHGGTFAAGPSFYFTMSSK
jgi:hypothetical protein